MHSLDSDEAEDVKLASKSVSVLYSPVLSSSEDSLWSSTGGPLGSSRFRNVIRDVAVCLAGVGV